MLQSTLDVKYHQNFQRQKIAQLFIWQVLKFWQIPILTNSHSDKFQFWQIPILTNSGSDKFQFLQKVAKNGFWQIPILTNSVLPAEPVHTREAQVYTTKGQLFPI